MKLSVVCRQEVQILCNLPPTRLERRKEEDNLIWLCFPRFVYMPNALNKKKAIRELQVTGKKIKVTL